MHCQEYVDLIRIGYGETFNNDFVDTEGSTEVQTLEADITFPVVLNKDHVLITGVNFSKNQLNLFPEGKRTSLYSTTLKLGLASTFNKTWSSTLVLLPKVASDYENIKGDDFYFGGLALLKFQKNEHLKYRFGFYATSEAFGFFTTPIIGWYYLSPNAKFEMDMSLPITAEVSYHFGVMSVGIDYYGIGRSFRLYGQSKESSTYVDLSSLEFAGYFEYALLQKRVLLRAKLGYSSNNFEVYTTDDKIDLGLSAFSFGDDRVQLNPDLNGGLYFKFEAIYRFHLQKEKSSD
jgi:hypothetical protein